MRSNPNVRKTVVCRTYVTSRLDHRWLVSAGTAVRQLRAFIADLEFNPRPALKADAPRAAKENLATPVRKMRCLPLHPARSLHHRTLQRPHLSMAAPAPSGSGGFLSNLLNPQDAGT